MAERQDHPGEVHGTDDDLPGAVVEEVSDARREIFGAYVRAREAGVILAQDTAPIPRDDER